MVRVEQIELVPHLEQPPVVVRVDPELSEDRLDVGRLRVAVLVRDVAHVQDHVGLDHLLERGAEGRHEHRRQVGDEADRVGQDHLGAVRQRQVAQRRVEVANNMFSASTLARVRRLKSVDLPALV